MNAYDHAATLLKALGHPTRLRIVQVLRRESACVCHLEAVVGERQATISQHLARLREAGLVIDQREGMNVYYALSDPPVGDFLDAVISLSLAQTHSDPGVFGIPIAPKTCPCPYCRTEPRIA